MAFEHIILQNIISKQEDKPKYRHQNFKIVLIDFSVLYVNEVITYHNYYLKYSYHWQDAGGNMIFRWDNSPHHPEITTFPHHKHIKTNEHVDISLENNLHDVLTFIAKQLTISS